MGGNLEEEPGSRPVHDTVDLDKSSHDEWLNSIIDEAECSKINASSTTPADQSCGEELPARLFHKVPQMLRETKEFETYHAPRVVSIGPYHYRNKKLHRMHKFKLIFARELVSNDKTTLDSLYEKLLEKIDRVKKCYKEISTNGLSDGVLTQMMVLDGLFILYFIQHYYLSGLEEAIAQMKACQISFVEMAQMKAYQISLVELDLLLLENQLPFFVLEELMKMIKPSTFYFVRYWDQQEAKSYWMLKVKRFIECINIMVRPRKRVKNVLDDFEKLQPAHLLDLLHKTMVGSESTNHEQRPNSHEEGNKYTVRNVKELKAVGIKVKLSKTSCLPDIQYTSCCLSGRLRLPPIKVDDSTKTKLMNLIAYEMYCPGDSNDKWVTSYVCFLDSFIDHADDVKQLRSAKILRNRLGSDEEVAKLFNEIGKGLVPHPCAYRKVKRRIQRHYDNKGLNYMAQLKQHHLKNPWTIIALFAGILLLFLTGVQTYFQVWSPPNECDHLCKYIKTNHHI